MATKKRGTKGSEQAASKASRGKPVARVKASAERPKLRAHAERPKGRARPAPAARPPARRAPRRADPGPGVRGVPAEPESVDRAASSDLSDLTPRPRAHGTVRKAPLTGPRRALPRRSTPPDSGEPSSETRELALAIAAAGIDKKAIGIEILDVSGKVDYADFLVIMTGRSDRHVHAIATGLEEALRTNKRVAPLSMEGLTAASWVLIDFGDVVVHVFQEDARRLYDIEGLWIDANRVPVPADGPGAPAPSPDFS